MSLDRLPCRRSNSGELQLLTAREVPLAVRLAGKIPGFPCHPEQPWRLALHNPVQFPSAM